MEKYYWKVGIVWLWHVICFVLIIMFMLYLDMPKHLNLFNFPYWIMRFWIISISIIFTLILNVNLWPEKFVTIARRQIDD